MIKIKLLALSTNKQFYKQLETEFERDKFVRKLKYAKELLVLN